MDEGKIAWDHVIPTVPVLRGHVKLPPPQLVGCRVLWATSPKLAALRYGGGRSKGTEIADRGTRGKCVFGSPCVCAQEGVTGSRLACRAVGQSVYDRVHLRFNS